MKIIQLNNVVIDINLMCTIVLNNYKSKYGTMG